MKWSIMKARMFARCQRKWYYYELAAHPNARDPIRREAYLLKQLQSVNAWRGSLIDTVIQKVITPKLNSHIVPNENDVLDYALKLMRSQVAFGKEKKHRCFDITKSNAGENYCAFHNLEYNGELKEESLKNAEEDIVTALKNLLSSELIANLAKDNQYIISQRTLSYNSFDDIRVVCVPDMIVFFEKKAPLIIDWKVHSQGNSDAWLQLGIYSIALSQVSPHKDFPENSSELMKNTSQIDLLEFQLLKNIQRTYSITDEDALDIEDYIFRSTTQMKHLVNERNFDTLDISLFQTARRPRICKTCQFKKLCWLTDSISESEPIQLTLFEAALT